MPSGRKPTPYIPLKCQNCSGDIVKRWNESFKYYARRKYCSTKCQHEHDTTLNTVKSECAMCCKHIVRKKSQVTETGRFFCSTKCHREWRKENSRTAVECLECKVSFEKLNNQIESTERNFCSRTCAGAWQSNNWTGERGTNWRGGISSLKHLIRGRKEYAEWRDSVFIRDAYSCKCCLDSKGGNLHAHHIKFFSEILAENAILNVEDALQCQQLWDVSNGITLCSDCHTAVHQSKLDDIYDDYKSAIRQSSA